MRRICSVFASGIAMAAFTGMAQQALSRAPTRCSKRPRREVWEASITSTRMTPVAACTFRAARCRETPRPQRA